jgi:hypothetical protein
MAERRIRNFAAEYLGRKAKAAREGRSTASARGHAGATAFRQPTNVEASLRGSRPAALEALHLARTENLSLAQASREARTTPDSVLRYTGPAWQKADNGRWRPEPSDDLRRAFDLPTSDGQVVTVFAESSAEASLVGRYHRAVQNALAGKPGSQRRLAEFEGVYVQGHLLVTDMYTLNRLSREGVLGRIRTMSGRRRR